MKNLVDVLKQKTRELDTLQQEVEALLVALRLCAENEAEAALVEKPLKMAAGSEGSTSNLTPKSMRQFP